MTSFLSKVRMPQALPLHKKLFNTALIFVLGIILGFMAKSLDEIPINLLPNFLEVLDLGNFFSRMGVWIFIAVALSIFSKSPLRAAINVFLFFIGMVGSYYLYTIFIAGFFPKTYMMLWIIVTAISPLMAFVCWYAKGNGVVSIVIASLIIVSMTRQAYSFGFWYFSIKYFLESLLWALTIVILYKTPKQILTVVLLGVTIALIISPLNMFFGML